MEKIDLTQLMRQSIGEMEEKLSEAQMAAAGDNSFDNARKIVEANAGRFVVTLDNGVLKVGMMIDAAE